MQVLYDKRRTFLNQITRKDLTLEKIEERKKKELKRRLTLGLMTLADLTQKERDALHMEESETALAYWSKEKEAAILADDAKRIAFTDGLRRRILVLTQKFEPSDSDNPLLAVLDHVQALARTLPAEHRRH